MLKRSLLDNFYFMKTRPTKQMSFAKRSGIFREYHFVEGLREIFLQMGSFFL